MYARVPNNDVRKALGRSAALVLLLGGALLSTSAQAGDLKLRGPASQLGFKSNGGGTSHDFQCGSETTPACDDAFAAKCKKAGGTLSETLPFGGKTCSTPGGW